MLSLAYLKMKIPDQAWVPGLLRQPCILSGSTWSKSPVHQYWFLHSSFLSSFHRKENSRDDGLKCHLSTYLPIYPSIYLSFYLSSYLSVYLSIRLSIYGSIYPSIHQSGLYFFHPCVCLSIHLCGPSGRITPSRQPILASRGSMCIQDGCTTGTKSWW
jgi:hypothetical protein